jgi:hypothetical protein
VNLRSLPWTSAPVVGAMDPQQFYPVYYFFDNPQDERWNQTSPGLAASWVTRLGGVCRGLPVLSFAEGAFGAADVGLASQFALSIDDLAFNPQPEPPPDPAALFPEEHFPFPAPQTREHVLLARFAPNVLPEPILVGLLLPAVQAAREAANATGEEQSVMFVVPGDIVGFNPQPEPPPGGDDPMPNPVEDTTQPYFQILMGILPSVAEGEGEDEIRLLPVDVVGMNLGETSIQSCEVSMKPADGDACIYTNDMGQVAACFASGMDTYCIYGYTPDPAEM